MDSNSKRRWLQIHLSTTIILTFVAAILLGLNVISRKSLEQADLNLYRLEYGWPYTADALFHYEGTSTRTKVSADGHEYFHYDPKRRKGKAVKNHPTSVTLVANVFVALLILMSVAMLCELIIRRPWERKP